MLKKLVLVSLIASSLISTATFASIPTGKKLLNHSILEATKSNTAYTDVLSKYSDLAIKIPADNKQKHSVIVFYDAACKYCNNLLMQIPILTSNNITVYVLPFLNHGLYSQQSKNMYLAWSTSQPLVSLLSGDLPKKPDLKIAQRMFEFTKFAQNSLNVTRTPYVLLQNGNYIDGSFNPTDLIHLLNKK